MAHGRRRGASRSRTQLAVLALLFGAGVAPSASSADAPTATALPVVRLTLKRAIAQAIASNPDLAPARIEVTLAEAGVDRAWAEFEPTGFAGGAWGKNRDPVFLPEAPPGPSAIDGLPPGVRVSPQTAFAWSGGVRERTPIGLGFELRYDDRFRRGLDEAVLAGLVRGPNPSYAPAFTAIVRQPLLRGVRPDLNLASVRVSRLAHRASLESFEDAALRLAFDVERAYWRLELAAAREAVARRALATATDELERSMDLRRAGRLSDTDVNSAELGVASREEQVIASEAARLDARDRLLRLLVPPSFAPRDLDVEVELADRPSVEEAPVDVAAAIAEALARRPDLRAASLEVEAATVRVERAEWDKLPRLDVVGSWSQLGLGDSHDAGHESAFSRQYYDYSIGFELEVPLFEIGPEAARRQAEADRLRARRRREALGRDLVIDIRTAARDLAAARARVGKNGVAIELARRQLAAERDRLAQGVVTSFEVLLRVESLVTVENALVGSEVDYMLARAALLRAKGTLLDEHRLRVE